MGNGTVQDTPDHRQMLNAQRTLRVGRPAAFAVLGVLIVWTRFAGLGQSLWHDEIYTVQHYIVPGPRGSFGHYGTNDVLFSLLSWLTIYLPGLGSSFYRLWSILPFIAGVVVVVAWLRRRAGDAVALLFGLLATASPLLLDLSTEARGYGLAFLASAVMTVSGYEAVSGAGARRLSVFTAAGVVGCWTLPTTVLPFAAASAALLLHRELRGALLRRLVVAAGAIAVFYALPAGRLLASSGQQFGTRLPWHAPVTGAPTELITAFLPAAAYGGATPRLALVAVVAPLLVMGWFAARRGLPSIDTVTTVPVVFTFVALTAGRLFVEPRFLSFLLVPLFVWAAFGLKALVARPLTPVWLLSATYFGTMVIVGAGVFAWSAANDIRLPVEANRAAARAVAASLKGGAGELVVNTEHPSDVLFYLARPEPQLALNPSRLERFLCSPHARTLVFVQQPFGDVHLANTSCLAKLGGSVRVFRQRDRGGRISVWTVPATRPTA